MTAAGWLALYGRVGALLLPRFACAAVGAVWKLKKRLYPGDFGDGGRGRRLATTTTDGGEGQQWSGAAKPVATVAAYNMVARLLEALEIRG